MIVRCKQYPELLIADLDVRFSKGAANVEDAATLSKLQGMEGLEFEFEEKVEEEEVFPCPHCEKEYKSQSALDKHIKEKHPEGDGADA